MSAKPSDFSSPGPGGIRDQLDLPSLTVSARPAPNAKENHRIDVAYGIDSLDKLIDAFDERERSLRKLKTR